MCIHVPQRNAVYIISLQPSRAAVPRKRIHFAWGESQLLGGREIKRISLFLIILINNVLPGLQVLS